MIANGPPHPLRLHVLSHPRTASNLFCKLFSKHPMINQQLSGYLRVHLFGPESQTLIQNEVMNELKTDRAMAVGLTYQVALDRAEKQIADTEAAVS